MRSHAKASSTGPTSARGSARLALCLVVSALAMLVFAAGAPASVFTRVQTGSFGPDGTAVTSFAPFSDYALAFDQASDKLYLSDEVPDLIHAFNTPTVTLPGGNFPLAITPSLGCTEIAVDNTAGASANRIYYVGGDQMIHGYDSAGLPLGGDFPLSPSAKIQCGLAVDSAGNIFVGDFQDKVVREFSSTGTLLATFPVSQQQKQSPFEFVGPGEIELDSNGDLFVSQQSAGVYKYTADSGYAAATQIAPPFVFGLAVDTTTHRLYAANSTSVAVYDATSGVFLYNFADKIPGAEYSGIAIDQATDTVYVGDRSEGKLQVRVFGPGQSFDDATVTLSAAKNITASGAEIGATITDNNALSTAWRLELSGDGGSNWKTVSSGETAGGQSNVAVSGTASGLDSNFDYKFRVVTNKGTDASTEAASGVFTFHTVALPPAISDIGAVNVSDTSARLVATIDPRNSATGYVFEYGLTPALGSSTDPLAIGGGIVPITVSQVLGSLSPDTDYYFRVSATNLTGTTTSSGRTMHTRAEPLPLPDGRRWEMVSPVEKNLVDVNAAISAGNNAGIAPDGDTAAFCTFSLPGERVGQVPFYCATYLSQRTPAGWQTSFPFPNICKWETTRGGGAGFEAALSRDFDHAVLAVPEMSSCPIPQLDPAAPISAGQITYNLYRQQDLGTSAYDLLSPQVGDRDWHTAGSNFAKFEQGSDDFSHLVYRNLDNQTAYPGDSPAPGVFFKLYGWRQPGPDCTVASPDYQAGLDACLSLISQKPNDEPFTTETSIPQSTAGTSVSRDGNRIYFYDSSNTSLSRKLYMRESDETTFAISASECTESCGETGGDILGRATPSGDRALFASCSKLTNTSSAQVCTGAFSVFVTAGMKLYRWDRNGTPGNRLVDLTADHEPADGPQPNYKGLIGASEDENTVYFAADGQIVSGAPTGSATKVYRWRWNEGSPSVDYLGSFNEQITSSQGNKWSEYLNIEPSSFVRRVTPDGRFLMIETRNALDRAADRDSDADIYRWDEAGGWICVSCQLPGVPSAGWATEADASFVLRGSLSEASGLRAVNNKNAIVVMSDDGQRIFFNSPDALVPADINGEVACPVVQEDLTGVPERWACQDVYVWQDGTLNLISSGIGPEPAYLIGSTPSGNDILFYTRDRLIGWDKDASIDIYDARVGGGFPEPPPQPPSCEGESCRGQGTSAPATTGAGTAVFEGSGNPKPKHRKPRKHRRKHHKRAHSRAANHDRRAGR